MRVVIRVGKMTASASDKFWTVRMGAAGRLVIPATVRRALDLRQGQRVLLRVNNGHLEVRPVLEALAHAQAIARRHPLSGKGLLSESLIRGRRKACRLSRDGLQ